MLMKGEAPGFNMAITHKLSRILHGIIPRAFVLFAACILVAPCSALIVEKPMPQRLANGLPVATTPSQGDVPISGVVIVRSPYGVISSGVLLESRRHVLTAAHVVKDVISDPKFPQARVEIHGSSTLSIPWRSVTLHPQYQKNPCWDTAIIELVDMIPPTLASAHRLTTTSPLGMVVVKCGWGKTGTPTTGETLPSGQRIAGLNRFDAQIDDRIAKILSFPKPSPFLLISDFDNGSAAKDFLCNNKGTGSHEAHLGNGDSGAPAFVCRNDGTWVIAAISVGRKTTKLDDDGYCNGSLGEVAIYIDASSLATWVATITSAKQKNK